MKTIRAIITLVLCSGLVFSVPSCVIFVKKDNGLHKGWNNPKNPHNPNSVKKSGKSNGNGNKNGNGKK